MTDIYEFNRSNEAQSVLNETPYVNKNYQYINDINGGIYSNSGLSLVQFDMSSIYNSSALTDPNQFFLTVPVTMVSAYSSDNNGTTVAPLVSQGPYSVHSLKGGYHNLVHSADLTLASKTVHQYVPNINAYTSFKLLSQMSQDDLANLGPSLGYGTVLDNVNSIRYNSSASQTNSGGATAYPTISTIIGAVNTFTNNIPKGGASSLANNFINAQSGALNIITTAYCANIAATAAQTLVASNTSIIPGLYVFGNGIAAGSYVVSVSGTALTLSATATAVTGNTQLIFAQYNNNFTDSNVTGTQNLGSYNNAINSRLKKIVDATNNTQNLYGSSGIMSTTNLNADFKPYSVVSGNYIITYDVAVIRLGDILNAMTTLPLMKKFDGILRIYLNTGVVGSAVNLNGAMVSSASSNTFSNTCPLIQNCSSLIPSTAVGIVSGLFISRPVSTSVFGINLNNSGASHFMTSCRIYYPTVTLKPEKLLNYISENRNKNVVYTDILFNQWNTITAGSQFSQLVQSGVSNIKSVIIMPLLSQTVNGLPNPACMTGVSAFSQLLSPFDTCPNTTGPFSLTNLQIAVGGQNILSTTLNYGFENFLEQTSLYEKINSSDIGLSCGLISQNYWENGYRVYYVDCSRSNNADLLTPRNVTISFTNNTQVTLDIMVFIEYYKSLVVDVETGNITM